MLFEVAVLLAASTSPVPSPSASASPAASAVASATPAASPTPNGKASPTPGETPATKRTVAVLVHAPGVEAKNAREIASSVLKGLQARGYGILHQDDLLSTLGVGSVKTVPDPLADIRAKLREADQAYLDLNLPAADAALRDAETGLTGKLGDPEVLPLLKRAIERRAVVLLAQNRIDAATEKLRALYILEPEYVPSKEYLAPQFKPAFDSAKTLAGSAPRFNVQD